MIYISLFLGFYIALPLDMPIHCFLVAIVFCEVSLTVEFSVFNQVFFPMYVCVLYMSALRACSCVCVCMCACIWGVHTHILCMVTCACMYAYMRACVPLCVKPKTDIKSLSRWITLFIEARSMDCTQRSLIWLAWLTTWLQGSPVSLFLAGEMQATPPNSYLHGF